MDQVKDIVRVLVAQRFWVLSVVVTLVGVIFWYLASTQLAFEAEEKTRNLNSSFNMAQQVAMIATHPNHFSHTKLAKSIKETETSVLVAWTKQYESQSKSLIWPKRLEEDFARAVQDMRPVESIPFPTPLDREISVQLRTRYRDYMHEVLPRLAEPIRAEWKPKGSGSNQIVEETINGQPIRSADDDKYIVHWDQKNQSQIAARFDWSKQQESVPKTLQILYAQEDFWVLESLMSIIAQTNGDVDARHKAAIKSIETIDLGADVAHISGQITRLHGPGQLQAAAAAAAAGQTDRPAPGTVAAGEFLSADPADYRYVDDKLNPIQASRLRGATNTQSATDAFLAVAKRFPVRLRLYMDIRKLNKLIAECGNASLPLEVRQVRINRGASWAQNQGKAGERPKFPGAPGEGKGTVDPYLTSIDLFGLVYLYNPPLRSLQGTIPENVPAAPAVGNTGAVNVPNVNPSGG